ncbi:serine/arginine repetitive matrix protein 1-like [Gracilinanus agilis]|uniref:serine/arginine repetitive matrix protein 1-like n=1 Tax=Gracilinanus agilis TaxID=191870 RepID=UPI001CFD22ED|nr:serine/arginine repetitive matrix protein 1-like [Gracilinanus agilis]
MPATKAEKEAATGLAGRLRGSPGGRGRNPNKQRKRRPHQAALDRAGPPPLPPRFSGTGPEPRRGAPPFPNSLDPTDRHPDFQPLHPSPWRASQQAREGTPLPPLGSSRRGRTLTLQRGPAPAPGSLRRRRRRHRRHCLLLLRLRAPALALALPPPPQLSSLFSTPPFSPPLSQLLLLSSPSSSFAPKGRWGHAGRQPTAASQRLSPGRGGTHGGVRALTGTRPGNEEEDSPDQGKEGRPQLCPAAGKEVRVRGGAKEKREPAPSSSSGRSVPFRTRFPTTAFLLYPASFYFLLPHSAFLSWIYPGPHQKKKKKKKKKSSFLLRIQTSFLPYLPRPFPSPQLPGATPANNAKFFSPFLDFSKSSHIPLP